MLEKLIQYDDTREYILIHLNSTPLEAAQGREDLYKYAVSCLINIDQEGVFGRDEYPKENIANFGREKSLMDLPWIQSPILDYLASKGEKLNEVFYFFSGYTVDFSRESKENFLRKTLFNRIHNEKSEYYALLSILCFRWQEKSPKRQRAEGILMETGKEWGEILNYFFQCVSDDVFTKGDFFLETLLSMYNKVPFKLTEPEVVPDNMVKLLNLLITSLQEQNDFKKTAMLHTQLMNRPLKSLLLSSEIEKSKECKTLQKKYLSLLGTLGQECSKHGNEYIYTDQMII